VAPARRAVGEIGAGLRDILPPAIAAVPIGLLFGAGCAGKGLSAAEVGLMSLLVYAGGAQFAAAELWTYPVPILALALSTLLINARHVLMGASLTPKLAGFSLRQRLAAFYFLTDESWALAERRASKHPVTPAYWFALALLLPTAWICSTVLGAWLGSFLGDPKRLGADFAFAALFIGLIAGFWKGPATGITIAASGAAASLTYIAAGPPWHVGAGAFAGIGVAYLGAVIARRREAA
jgi:4-azaleucine resistance transporter AzlC